MPSHNISSINSTPPGRVDKRNNWTSFVPNRYLGPNDKRPVRYKFEVVSICKSPQSGLIANHGHCFIRLIDTDGGVYSVGFFPDESMAIEPNKYPGLRMPGMYLSPDKYDCIDWNPVITTVDLDITHFNIIVRYIEEAQARSLTRGESFDLVENNCVTFVVAVARLAGLEISATIQPSDFLFYQLPIILHKPLRWLFNNLPLIIRTTSLNLYLVLHGGMRVLCTRWLPEIPPQFQSDLEIKPFFVTWHQVISKKTNLYHVRALRDWQILVNSTITQCPLPKQPSYSEPPKWAKPYPTNSGS